MSAKNILNQWLAAGETDRVVESLQKLAKDWGDPYFSRDVTHQAGRYNTLQNERNKGLLDDRSYNQQINAIRLSLQNLIERLPDTFTLNTTVASKSSGMAISTHSPSVSPHLPWIIGLSLLIGSAIVLVGFVPCPTQSVENIFRLLMALGAGGGATILPGVFHLKFNGVKTGSAIGIFTLVYLINPAGAVKDNSRCEKLPFEFTISVMPEKGLNQSPNYPKLSEAVLKIRLDNKWEPSTIDSDGDADYKSIPGDFQDQKVAVKLQAKYWKLLQDSVVLSGKSSSLTIMSDGSLEKVEGKVLEEDGSTPIHEASVEVEGCPGTTDTRGNFSIRIPLEKQQTRYVLIAKKKGFQTETIPIFFDWGAIEIRLDKQQLRRR